MVMIREFILLDMSSAVLVVVLLLHFSPLHCGGIKMSKLDDENLLLQVEGFKMYRGIFFKTIYHIQFVLKFRRCIFFLPHCES